MKDPWFIVKSHGYGLEPNGVAGWLSTGVLVALNVGLALGGERLRWPKPTLAFSIVALNAVLIGVMWLKSDRKPWRWRWGDRD